VAFFKTASSTMLALRTPHPSLPTQGIPECFQCFPAIFSRTVQITPGSFWSRAVDGTASARLWS
jgi:hypothetical protein